MGNVKNGNHEATLYEWYEYIIIIKIRNYISCNNSALSFVSR